jgi:hypothetical protein
MHSQAREWLVLVEHRGSTPLEGACFEYVIVAPTEKSAESRAREKHDYDDTHYKIVTSVTSPLPTNVASITQGEQRESRTRIS